MNWIELRFEKELGIVPYNKLEAKFLSYIYIRYNLKFQSLINIKLNIEKKYNERRNTRFPILFGKVPLILLLFNFLLFENSESERILFEIST